MEMETPSGVMEMAGKIIRKSIFTFLRYFHYFTTIPVLLLLPFSASVLLSEALFPSSSSALFLIIHAAGFSSYSEFISLVNTNLSDHQTMLMYLVSLPITLSCFLIAKASIVQALNIKHHKPSLSISQTFLSIISLSGPPILTHLCNSMLIITINTIIFSTFFLALNYLEVLGLSYKSGVLLPLAGVICHGMVVNMVVTSKLALVVAGMENCRGYAAIYKACLLRNGRNLMVLLLALPTNFGLAAMEALFRYRVLRVHHSLGGFSACVALEGMLIAYLHALLVVLDTIAFCLFYKNCESSVLANQSDQSCDDHIVLVQEKEILEVLPC